MWCKWAPRPHECVFCKKTIASDHVISTESHRPNHLHCVEQYYLDQQNRRRLVRGDSAFGYCTLTPGHRGECNMDGQSESPWMFKLGAPTLRITGAW